VDVTFGASGPHPVPSEIALDDQASSFPDVTAPVLLPLSSPGGATSRESTTDETLIGDGSDASDVAEAADSLIVTGEVPASSLLHPIGDAPLGVELPPDLGAPFARSPGDAPVLEAEPSFADLLVAEAGSPLAGTPERETPALRASKEAESLAYLLTSPRPVKSTPEAIGRPATAAQVMPARQDLFDAPSGGEPPLDRDRPALDGGLSSGDWAALADGAHGQLSEAGLRDENGYGEPVLGARDADASVGGIPQGEQGPAWVPPEAKGGAGDAGGWEAAAPLHLATGPLVARGSFAEPPGAAALFLDLREPEVQGGVAAPDATNEGAVPAVDSSVAAGEETEGSEHSAFGETDGAPVAGSAPEPRGAAEDAIASVGASSTSPFLDGSAALLQPMEGNRAASPSARFLDELSLVAAGRAPQDRESAIGTERLCAAVLVALLRRGVLTPEDVLGALE
jgi:hypothetical protein